MGEELCLVRVGKNREMGKLGLVVEIVIETLSKLCVE
jgi:hypothetical protein